jgi:UDP-GlcNAc:undecaprenyl-phosphate GlcNAc-1-phosphate transferase
MMVISNGYLTIFAIAMMGCVLATPLVTRIASWVGAIDRPDQFRRIHRGAVPRLGGLGLALGIAAGVLLPHVSSSSSPMYGRLLELHHEWAIFIAAVIILAVGFVDDTRSMGPRMKLMGQALAVMALYLGGIRIQAIDVLGLNLDLTQPNLQFNILGLSANVGLPSLSVTMLWFLGCINVWNLIDGMDGLASGVGLLVSGTLTLVAIHNENVEVAILAVALAGSLAGFLLYNWHPACIFLGDSGALLIGLLIGVIGVQGSMKGPSTISILFPILAMGLPISDTAMAIFRRWVRNLPLSAADRRHVHHLLIGLGLNPRQAALMLYCFSGFLCGAVLLGVALRSEFLALIMGVFGCLAFLVVVTSRRDELNNLREDFQDRLMRGRQERQAAELTWEAIQRIELCESVPAALDIVEQTARLMGCRFIQISCTGQHSQLVTMVPEEDRTAGAWTGQMSGLGVIFRLSGGQEAPITIRVELGSDLEMAADIVFRYLQRLGQALAGRVEWIQSLAVETSGSQVSALQAVPLPAFALSTNKTSGFGRIFMRLLRTRPRGFRPLAQGTAHGLQMAETVAAPTTLARR